MLPLLLAAFQGLAAEPEVHPVIGQVVLGYPVEARAEYSAARPVGERLRVGSYNIQDFTDAIHDGTNRTPERLARQARIAAALIDEINPDVLVLQEIENAVSLSVLNNTLPEPYPLAYVTKFGERQQRDLNIAVLARVPITGLRALDFSRLSGSGRPPRGVLSFIVHLNERHKLLVYVVHLKSNYGDRSRNIAKRRSALEIVAEDARHVRARYTGYEWEMLVLGDMNVDAAAPEFADDPSLAPLADWVDLWLGMPLEERMTLPTRYGDPMQQFPPVTFDRFFASRELKAAPWVAGKPGVLQKGVDTQNIFAVGGENDIQASDHFPIYVDLTREAP